MTTITFTQRLRAAMEAKGWTKYRLGKQAGITQQFIGRILRNPDAGATVGGDTVRKLAEALEVTPEWLLSGEGEERPKPATRLRDREEWADVEAQVLKEHPELSENVLALVGEMPDNLLTFPGKLDRSLVHGLAATLRDWHARSKSSV